MKGGGGHKSQREKSSGQVGGDLLGKFVVLGIPQSEFCAKFASWRCEFQCEFLCEFFRSMSPHMSPQAIPDKATLPDFPFFLFLTLRMFRIFHFFGCIFCCFTCVLQHAAVDPHVPHILWIEYEENWDDWLCQGWVWVHTMRSAEAFLGGFTWQ